jgi:hypothetical protein
VTACPALMLPTTISTAPATANTKCFMLLSSLLCETRSRKFSTKEWQSTRKICLVVLAVCSSPPETLPLLFDGSYCLPFSLETAVSLLPSSLAVWLAARARKKTAHRGIS